MTMTMAMAMTTTSLGNPNYLSIMALVLLLPYGMTAYPVFGTKRYGRSSTPMGHNGAWGIGSVMHVPSYYYQAMPARPQTHYPVSYYEAMAPYAPDYTDDYYYPQEAMSYQLYYPLLPRSGSKYDMYQSAMPYYYGDRHMPRPGYNYYDQATDPVDDLQEEMLHQEEREEREEALPIGQETWYESDGSSENDESMDDVNAAFLQNLMMYNDAISNQNYDYGKQQPVDSYMQQYKDYNDDYPTWAMDNLNKNYGAADEDVKELKMLAEKPKKQKTQTNKKHTTAAQERMQMFNRDNKNSQKNLANADPNNSEAWINWDNKRAHKQRLVDPVPNLALKKQEHSQHGPLHFGSQDHSFANRKQQASKTASTSTASPTVGHQLIISTEQPGRDARGGQKEVVLMRPATPVHRPFSEPVMELLAQQGGPERKRTPSVYDTIKHLLEMEKNLEEEYQLQQQLQRTHLRAPMRKRYVSNEESLVEELSGLKKTA